MQNNKQNLVHQTFGKSISHNLRAQILHLEQLNNTNIIRTLRRQIKYNSQQHEESNFTSQQNISFILFYLINFDAGSVSYPITVRKIQSLLTKTQPLTK